MSGWEEGEGRGEGKRKRCEGEKERILKKEKLVTFHGIDSSSYIQHKAAVLLQNYHSSMKTFESHSLLSLIISFAVTYHNPGRDYNGLLYTLPPSNGKNCPNQCVLFGGSMPFPGTYHS